VSLDDDGAVLLRDRLARAVEAVEEVALLEEVALGRVDVLRLERIVLVQLARLESAHLAARVREGEHEPAREVVVAALSHETCCAQLLLLEAFLQRAARERRPTGRVAEPELPAHVLPEAAAGEVLAREGAGVAVPEHALVEDGRTFEQ